MWRHDLYTIFIFRGGWLIMAALFFSPGVSCDAAVAPSATQVLSAPVSPRFYIEEYQVKGNGHLLSQTEFENAVYPYLGPYRTPDDVEQARAALEKAYRDKGYRTIAVAVPPQSMKAGVVTLQVIQNPIGRLRITGSRYFSLDQIKREAPSLSEGTVPDFNQVTKDLVVLNQSPDRRITPSLQAGMLPGTIDVNLAVKDTFPLHGSLELNNRYSADTTPLRVNG
jgi:hemolysin activation/secretion protein